MHALGQTVWEYMRDHPEDNAAFNQGLAEIRKDEQAAIAAAYEWTGVTTVVDVGGGAGALLASPPAPRLCGCERSDACCRSRSPHSHS